MSVDERPHSVDRIESATVFGGHDGARSRERVAGERPDPLGLRRHGHVGQPRARVDGPLKVTGSATFAAEFAMDRMVYASLAFSTIALGRIVSIEVADAEAAPGVVLVMTHRNAPRMKAPPMLLSSGEAASGDNLPVMQDDRVHWNGQPVAVVLAHTQEQADHATSLIRMRLEGEPAVTDFEIARLTPRVPDNVIGEAHEHRTGDAEDLLRRSEVSVDLRYHTPFQNHNAMEPHAVTLAWQGRSLRVHDSTQGVKSVAGSLAEVFGIETQDVHVTSPYVGGGFGGKMMWQHQVLAAAAAKLARRPVRLTLTREGVYRTVGGRAMTEQRVAIGADRTGRFRSIIHTGVSATTPNAPLPEPFTQPTKILYGADAMLISVLSADLAMLANTFMRAPGEATGSFAFECAVDELAERLKIDPIALRLMNEPSVDPIEGTTFSSRHLAQTFQSGAERFGWEDRTAPRSRRDGEWWVGMGTAAATYPHIRYPGGAARLTLTSDGRITAEVAANDMGMGTETVHAQVVAERTGLSPDDVTFRYGDSRLAGNVLAGGAQQTGSIGLGVMAAYDELIAELLTLAGNDSPLAGLRPDEVQGTNRGLACVGDPGRHETYVSILSRAGRERVSAEGHAPAPTENRRWSMHSYGAIFTEVRVHAVTAETRVSRVLGAFDCGRILNTRTAASQFRGGIVMGLGLALMEETQMDPRNGRIMNPSLAEYHIPVHADVPPIEVIWTDIADPHAPMGARGVGEIGIVGVGAAIANAVHNATGQRVRSLPITLDKLL